MPRRECFTHRLSFIENVHFKPSSLVATGEGGAVRLGGLLGARRRLETREMVAVSLNYSHLLSFTSKSRKQCEKLSAKVRKREPIPVMSRTTSQISGILTSALTNQRPPADSCVHVMNKSHWLPMITCPPEISEFLSIPFVSWPCTQS